MSLTNTQMNEILVHKTKFKDLTDARKKEIWESDFKEDDILNGYYITYQSLKEQCKPVDDVSKKIEILKECYEYERPLIVRPNLLEEFVADCGKFGVYNKDFILVMLSVKTSTIVNVGEFPIPQISGESGAGKSYGKTVLTYGFGWVPYITEKGVVYLKSVSNIGGTPLVAAYSTLPEDRADGMILDLDDQRNVNETTAQILLQATNARFMEQPIYKAVENQSVRKFALAINQRFILTAVRLPQPFLDAGLSTRTLKVEVKKQDERELQKLIFADGDLDKRLKAFCDKWSAFWTNLYDAVYFKGKRTHVELPEKYKTTEAFLNLGVSRSYQHVKAIAAVLALFRDPEAVIEGRPLLATEEEVEIAAAFVRTHTYRSMEDDETSPLSGNWIKGDVSTEIAEELMRDNTQGYIPADLQVTVMNMLNKRNEKNVKQRAERFVRKFLKSECREKNGIWYKVEKSK